MIVDTLAKLSQPLHRPLRSCFESARVLKDKHEEGDGWYSVSQMIEKFAKKLWEQPNWDPLQPLESSLRLCTIYSQKFISSDPADETALFTLKLIFAASQIIMKPIESGDNTLSQDYQTTLNEIVLPGFEGLLKVSKMNSTEPKLLENISDVLERLRKISSIQRPISSFITEPGKIIVRYNGRMIYNGPPQNLQSTVMEEAGGDSIKEESTRATSAAHDATKRKWTEHIPATEKRHQPIGNSPTMTRDIGSSSGQPNDDIIFIDQGGKENFMITNVESGDNGIQVIGSGPGLNKLLDLVGR